MRKSKINGNKNSVKIAFIVSTIAVLFIPMLYSTIYLGAFWDPYERLDHVPVAFVNLDKKVIKDGKTYDIGKELQSNLRENKKLAWKFVDANKAEQGLKGTDYYASIIIPENFSEKMSEVEEGEIQDLNIIYKANKGKNFIFSQLSQKAAENIKSEINSNIQKEITESLVGNMYTIKDSIKDAEDGVVKLKDGTEKLSQGGNKLNDGTQKAYDGTIKLQEGLKSASDGSEKLKNGTQMLSDGSRSLSQGIDIARGGSIKLESGLIELSKGQEKLVVGSSQLVAGLENVKSNLVDSGQELNPLINDAQSTEGLDYLSLNLNKAADGVKSSSNSISTISQSMKLQIENVENSNMKSEDKEKLKTAIMMLEEANKESSNSNMEESIRGASRSLEPLIQGITKLDQETEKLSSGIDRLLKGAKEIESGSKAVLLGLNTVSSKTGELSYGLGEIYTGSNSLNTGILSFKDGSDKLNQGLDTAYLKTGDLTTGIEALNIGSESLSKGIESLDKGNFELKTGLNNGYRELDHKLKFKSNDMADFISNPINIMEKSINDINHYGEGLAPYFIALSLWLGAMFINLIISIGNKVNKDENKNLKKFIKKLIIGIVLVSIQSMILSFSLILVLKIETVSLIGFYMSNMLISIVFYSIMYGVSYAIGIIGTPIMFIFFILQISSAGGTFPIETAPVMYRNLNNVIPMTYAVNILRMVISGINKSIFNNSLIVMLVFMVASLSGGLTINLILRKIKSGNKQNKEVEN